MALTAWSRVEWWGAVDECVCVPLIDALCPYGVHSVYVRYMKDGLVSRGVSRELHQNLVEEDGL